tara:strand:+ start:3604 stop:3774 length:171 start_codon:yes stop_codon:yes gene_type:complete
VSEVSKVKDFLPVGVFLMGGYLAIYGLTNPNKMIKAGEWLPITGIITMHLAMEKME